MKNWNIIVIIIYWAHHLNRHYLKHCNIIATLGQEENPIIKDGLKSVLLPETLFKHLNLIVIIV
jgi:hypothetical protein